MEGNNRQLTLWSRVTACMQRHHRLRALPQWAFHTLQNAGSWLNCSQCLSDFCDVVRCVWVGVNTTSNTFHDMRTRQHSLTMIQHVLGIWLCGQEWWGHDLSKKHRKSGWVLSAVASCESQETLWKDSISRSVQRNSVCTRTAPDVGHGVGSHRGHCWRENFAATNVRVDQAGSGCQWGHVNVKVPEQKKRTSVADDSDIWFTAPPSAFQFTARPGFIAHKLQCISARHAEQSCLRPNDRTLQDREASWSSCRKGAVFNDQKTFSKSDIMIVVTSESTLHFSVWRDRLFASTTRARPTAQCEDRYVGLTRHDFL